MAVILAALGCGGGDGASVADPTTSPSASVATVTVALASAEVWPDETTNATATLRDGSGVALTGRTVAWQSDNTAVATVDASTGKIKAIGPGTARVTATSEGRSGSASITVLPYVKLRWPVKDDARDWVIDNYVDLDPTPGLRDFRGNTGADAKTYDGHNGIDISSPNFRWMDGDLAPVYAAAVGVVIEVVDGRFDRNVACVSNDPNIVKIRHADGRVAWYMHFKKGSIVVTVGQQVAVGTKLGIAGSSGCSTAPHVHFELRSAANVVIDPFESGLWIDAPVYDAPLAFMDGMVSATPFSDVGQLKDPSPNATTVPIGTTVGLGATAGGGKAGDFVRMVLQSPTGTVVSDARATFDRLYRHTYWYWNRTLGSAGSWTVSFYTNGFLAKTYVIDVK